MMNRQHLRIRDQFKVFRRIIIAILLMMLVMGIGALFGTMPDEVTGKGSVQILVTPYRALNSLSAVSAKDLRGLDEGRARAALLTELSPLSGVVAQLALSLPEKDRTALLHDLRTDEWMNGPVVPVPQENASQPADAGDENNWVVEEDQQ